MSPETILDIWLIGWTIFLVTLFTWVFVRYPNPRERPERKEGETGLRFLLRMAADYLDFYIGGFIRTLRWLLTPKESENA